ncbi:MAG: histidine kinase dimerization/phospho-acceptor domain-containing protein [Gammaproteobacteria bacterium]|nr:histidine kinase dimerization/phospho-acceptor domain-containing protein [Gammaproteobacteria bacterium]
MYATHGTTVAKLDAGTPPDGSDAHARPGAMINLLTELLPGLLLGAASLTLAVRLRRRRAFVSDPQRLRILAGLAAAGGGLWILAAASRVPAISMACGRTRVRARCDRVHDRDRSDPVASPAGAGATAADGATAGPQRGGGTGEPGGSETRIDSLGTLAGGVAHDFNNLLTVIAGHTDLLRRSEHPDQRDESLQALEAATERAEALCRRMLAYSGRGHFLLSPTRLVDCIRVDAEAAEEAGIHLELQLEDGPAADRRRAGPGPADGDGAHRQRGRGRARGGPGSGRGPCQRHPDGTRRRHPGPRGLCPRPRARRGRASWKWWTPGPACPRRSAAACSSPGSPPASSAAAWAWRRSRESSGATTRPCSSTPRKVPAPRPGWRSRSGPETVRSGRDRQAGSAAC